MKCDILPVNPGTFSLPENGDTHPELLGGTCSVCQTSYYPKPTYCPKCLGEILEQAVGSRGRIHSLTVIRTKPPMGLPRPYSVGFVDLEKTGLRVFGLLDPEQIDKMQIGDRVCLSVRELGHDGRGDPRLRPVFTLLSEVREA